MRIYVVVAALATMLLTGCGSDSPSGSDSGPGSGLEAEAGTKDPCKLVTDAEVSSAIGVEVTRVGGKEQARGRSCDWTYPRGEGREPADLVVSAWRGKMFYALPTGGTEVSGLGDEAHQSASWVMFRKGEDVIQVFIMGDQAGRGEKELAVARLVAGKL